MRNNRNRRKGDVGGSAGSESGMYYLSIFFFLDALLVKVMLMNVYT